MVMRPGTGAAAAKRLGGTVPFLRAARIPLGEGRAFDL
jgi:hypothetical protein